MNKKYIKQPIWLVLLAIGLLKWACTTRAAAIDKEVVLVVGKVSVGKTTLLASLGSEMVKNRFIVIKEGTARIKPLPEIGHPMERKTQQYQLHTFLDKPALILCDTRGFLTDPEYIEENKQAFDEISLIFDQYKVKGIIFVTDISEWQPRYNPLFDVLGSFLTHFIPEDYLKSNFWQSVCIVVQVHTSTIDHNVILDGIAACYYRHYKGKNFNTASLKNKKLLFDKLIQNIPTGDEFDMDGNFNGQIALKEDKIVFYHPLDSQHADKLHRIIKRFKGIKKDKIIPHVAIAPVSERYAPMTTLANTSIAFANDCMNYYNRFTKEYKKTISDSAKICGSIYIVYCCYKNVFGPFRLNVSLK